MGPGLFRWKTGLQPGRVASPSQGHLHTNSYTQLESPINRTCMFWDCGRKMEYLKKYHTNTRRTFKLHAESHLPESETETLFLWGDRAVYPTVFRDMWTSLLFRAQTRLTPVYSWPCFKCNISSPSAVMLAKMCKCILFLFIQALWKSCVRGDEWVPLPWLCK